jgi:hypothetical protein
MCWPAYLARHRDASTYTSTHLHAIANSHTYYDRLSNTATLGYADGYIYVYIDTSTTNGHTWGRAYIVPAASLEGALM